MSYTKRYIDDECQRLADKYGYSWDLVMDALNYTEYNWSMVERLAKKGLLKYWVGLQALEEKKYEAINKEPYFPDYKFVASGEDSESDCRITAHPGSACCESY